MATGAFLLALLGSLTLAGCQGEARQADRPEGEAAVGLLSSLPLVMPEAADISELLADRSAPHWALAVLGEKGKLKPLDRLAGPDGKVPLASNALLVMAQPWPLSPQENVALDEWVRSGGRVLLFADPMLTFESRFALGDRRRPQGMVMLSPILARWGLGLERDEDLPPEQFPAGIGGAMVPIVLPGRFALLDGSGCVLEAQGLLAKCRIGAGSVVALADAALLEVREDDSQGTRAAALKALLDRLSD